MFKRLLAGLTTTKRTPRRGRLWKRRKSRSHMEKRTFGTGGAAMNWLLRGAEPASAKSASSGSKSPPARSSSTAAARRALIPEKHAPKPTMTAAQYIATLPEPLSMLGPNSASRAEVAKRIRKELDGAIKAGALPRSMTYGMRVKGNGIYIDIKSWPGQVFSNKYTEHLMDPTVKWDPQYWDCRDDAGVRMDSRLSPELNRAIKTIEKIGERHNFDNSDSQTDYFHYGYSLHVDADTVEDIAKNGIRHEVDKAFGELMEKVKKAAAAVGPAATKSILNTSNIAAASPVHFDHLFRVADRAKGQPVAYDASRRDWFPVDPREGELEILTLGNTDYRIVSKGAGFWSLMGRRGGSSGFTQSRRNPDQWAHVNGNVTTWYRKNADGTFTRI